MKKTLLIGWFACIFLSNLFSGDSVDSRDNDFDHLDDDSVYEEVAFVAAPEPEYYDDITEMLRVAGYHVGDNTPDKVFSVVSRPKAKPRVPTHSYDSDLYDSKLIDLNEVLRARGYDLGDNVPDLPEMIYPVAPQSPVAVVYEPGDFGGAGSGWQPQERQGTYLEDNMDYLGAQV